MVKKIAKPKKGQQSNQLSGFRQTISALYTVWIFFTRLPWPGAFLPGKTPALLTLGQAARAFPFAGIVIGAIAAAVLFVASRLGLHPLAASILGIGAGIIVSGAMHEDGLADVVDGFGGGTNKTQKLEIMKDSRIGSYGVLALVIVTGLKATVIAGLPSPGIGAGALFVANVLARSGLPILMIALKPAKKTGLNHDAGRPKKEDAAIAAIIGTLVGVLVFGPGIGIAAAVVAALGLGAVGYVAQAQIGGLTGDVLGAGEQIAEILVFLALGIILADVF